MANLVEWSLPRAPRNDNQFSKLLLKEKIGRAAAHGYSSCATALGTLSKISGHGITN
jgi:hypothetical protein